VQRYVLPPAEIETLSMQRVETSLRALDDLPEAGRDLVRRIVYATGDPTLAPLIRIHPDAISAGVAALRAGKPILVDVRMVAVALDGRLTARLGCQVLCAIDAAPEAEDASSRSLPRALRGVRALAPELDGGIAVVGTAPTALLELLDLVDAGIVRPALIIGTPVGFVAAADSKAELAARPVPFITVQGTRGGAAMAAAAANTLLRVAASGSELRVPDTGP
jgi:precorrin-8X/cobalt-precorrin-8 methylmutase